MYYDIESSPIDPDFSILNSKAQSLKEIDIVDLVINSMLDKYKNQNKHLSLSSIDATGKLIIINCEWIY